MEVVGLGVDEVDLVFRLLASLLKLSNLSFLPRANIDATEGCSIVNEYGKSWVDTKTTTWFLECFVFLFLCPHSVQNGRLDENSSFSLGIFRQYFLTCLMSLCHDLTELYGVCELLSIDYSRVELALTSKAIESCHEMIAIDVSAAEVGLVFELAFNYSCDTPFILISFLTGFGKERHVMSSTL